MTLRTALVGALLLASMSSAHAQNTENQVSSRMSPEAAAGLFESLQVRKRKETKQKGARIRTEWRPANAREARGRGWAVVGNLRTEYRAFEAQDVRDVFSRMGTFFKYFGTHAPAVRAEFEYSRRVEVSYSAASRTLTVAMPHTQSEIGTFNLALEGDVDQVNAGLNVDLPDISIISQKFQVGGTFNSSGKRYRAYATGLPYTLRPVLSIRDRGELLGAEIIIGTEWRSSIELTADVLGESNTVDLNVSVDAQALGVVPAKVSVGTGVSASTARESIHVTLSSSGKGLKSALVFDESAEGEAYHVYNVIDVNWQFAMTALPITNFGSLHKEEDHPVDEGRPGERVSAETLAAQRAAEQDAPASLRVFNESVTFTNEPPSNAEMVRGMLGDGLKTAGQRGGAINGLR